MEKQATPVPDKTTTQPSDPRRDFETPDALVQDADLSVEEKLELLKDWRADVDAELVAEAEGMYTVTTDADDRDASLADEASEAQQATAALSGLQGKR